MPEDAKTVNAPTESWFNSFKNERVFGERFSTREAMKATAFDDIEVFYNRKRLHSTLGYTSPVQFLKDWRINTQQGEKQVYPSHSDFRQRPLVNGLTPW